MEGKLTIYCDIIALKETTKDRVVVIPSSFNKLRKLEDKRLKVYLLKHNDEKFIFYSFDTLNTSELKELTTLDVSILFLKTKKLRSFMSSKNTKAVNIPRELNEEGAFYVAFGTLTINDNERMNGIVLKKVDKLVIKKEIDNEVIKNE